MTPDDLAGVGIKLDRAEVHLNTINAAVRNFIEVDLNNAQSFSDIDPFNQKWQVVRWREVPSVDPMLGAVLGDFVHNIRSGLDQLMWSLVRANKGKPGNYTQWPASETEGKWRDDVLERDIETRGLPPTHGLSNEAFSLVQNFQPFRHGAHLFRLVRLSNEDKHRTLHVGHPFLTEGPEGVRFEPRGYLDLNGLEKPNRPMPINDGTPFVRLKVRRIAWPPPEHIQVKMAFDRAGVHLGFYAGEQPIAAIGDISPMLKSAREIRVAALALPEIAR
ncbi:MAG TPA: hypothetical protein VK988_12135 [Acidimicrobiales bacterium]|nr:hypothetical protein [Acidimicrobiales bacterium]